MKKTQKFIVAIIVAIITAGMVSCDNREFSQINKKKSPEQGMPLSEINGGERILTDAQIEEIGEAHNNLVLDFFTKYDYSNSDALDESLTQFSRMEMMPYTTIATTIDYIPNDFNDNILRENLSNSAYTTIKQFFDDCYAVESLVQLEELAEQTTIYAKKNFVGAELDVVLIAISVSKHSAELWLSKDKGGMDLGQQIIDNFQQNNPNYAPAGSKLERLKIALTKCFIADMNGAIETMVNILAESILGIGAALNPVTVKATVLTVATGAAMSSIIEAIRIIVFKDYVIFNPDTTITGVILKYKDITITTSKLKEKD